MLKTVALTLAALALSGCAAKGGCDPRLPARYDGALIQGSGSSAEDSKVFLVAGGEKHWATSWHWLNDHGFAAKDLRVVPSEEIACLPEGTALQ